jgi:hypothetical protein
MTEMFIYPDWPAPESIQAVSTSRHGGLSQSPYNTLNLGDHVGDDIDTVTKNRERLAATGRLPNAPLWLNQVHGTDVVIADSWQHGDNGDAISSCSPNQVCAIMTADCLPILLCNKQGDQVAAIHAGWRGLAAGIVEKTLRHFNCLPNEIIAWLGPAIGPQKFEVGHDVFEAFTLTSPTASKAFQQIDSEHFLADIYLLAKQRLNAYGIHAIFGGDRCTVSEPEHFFSYRRDGITGRMASMIWITHK